MPPRARPTAPIIPPTQSGSSDDDGNPNSELSLLLAKMEKATIQRRAKARVEIEKGFNSAIDQFIADCIAEFKVEAAERQRLRADRLKLVIAYVEKRRKAETEIEGLVERLQSSLVTYVGVMGETLEEMRTGVEKEKEGGEDEEGEGKVEGQEEEE